MEFELTDAGGKPTAGAISVAVVDEAVFSVLSQSAGLTQLFFQLDEKLLKPVYAVYEQWSPLARDGVPEEIREQFDEAMFCLTARAAGGVDGTLLMFSQGESSPEADFEMREPMPMDNQGFGEFTASAPSTPFNLTAATYRGKAERIAKERRMGLQGTYLAWGALGASLFVMFITALMMYERDLGCCILTVLGIVMILATLLLPAVQSAREASKATMARNLAREMEMLADDAAPEMAMEGGMLGGVGGLGGDGVEPIRVRQDFPETLLWLPELVTDDAGRTSLDIDLADSITTWRLSAAAVSGQGQLGSGEFPIRVFPPFFVDFNLPVALTRGDEAAIPVVVYNYLETPQTVTLNFAPSSWYERMGDDPNAELKIELAPREVKSLSVRIKVLEVGRQQLEATARGGEIADAIRRDIEVVPNGRRVDQSFSGRVEGRIDYPLELPAERIEGSTAADRQDLSRHVHATGGRARFDLPDAARLLRANFVDHVSQRAGPRLSQAHEEVVARRGGQGPAVHSPRLPAAGELRGQWRRLRLVRQSAGQPHPHGLRADGVRRHGARA